jgi:Divergent InlB B-repeat domain
MPRILLVALAAATFAAAPSAAIAATGTLQVAAVGAGQVTVTPDPIVPDPTNCSSPVSSDRAGTNGIEFCTFTYEVGTRVELVAEGVPSNAGPATSLGRWSDDRCPPTQSCTWIIGPDRETVAALFTPQRLSVKVGGEGNVTSAEADLTIDESDPPAPCSTAGPVITCVTDVHVGTPVTLIAKPTQSAITPNWLGKAANGLVPLCDNAPPPCTVIVDRPRWASVGFGVAPEDPGVPPEITVAFRVRKAGGGTGTVSSGLVACGGQCSRDTSFGTPDTLTATPDPGSRFDHWGAGCGTAPRCSLAVGPVTALTAFFERGPPGGGSQQQQQSTRPRLSARVLRLKVTGHGRKRTIFVRLRVNVASTVRVVLLRGRKRVATRSFRVKPGTPLVRFRVPKRVKAGTYRLRLTIKGNGQTRQLTRRVRLPR